MEAAIREHTSSAALLQQPSQQQQQQQQQQQADVVTLLLQQPAVASDQAIVCKLLATSKALARLVTELCRGSLSIRYEAAADDQQQRACFVQWLQRHSHLVQHWHWRSAASAGAQQQAFEEALALALQETAAAASAAGSPKAAPTAAAAAADTSAATYAAAAAALSSLQSYVCSSAGPAAHSILAVLPASCLTKLELQFTYQGVDFDLSVHTSSDSSRRSKSASLYAASAAALAGLTSLRNLFLQTKWFPVDQLLVSSSSGSSSQQCVQSSSCSLSGLSQLTQLFLGRLWDMQCLQQLPTQLQQLQLLLHDQDAAAQPLQLGRLAGLTHLSLHGNFAGFAPQDELPAGLRALHVASCTRCVQPLLGLSQLTQLCVEASRTPAAELQQLAETLASLHHVELGYKSAAAADAAAAAWAALPLKSLDISTYCGLAAATFEALGQVTRLTRLIMRSMPLNPHNVTPCQLAGHLRQLTALQELQVVRFDFQQQQQMFEQDLQELRHRQQLYQQLNEHLRQLHLQRQQQPVQQSQDDTAQELQQLQQHSQQAQQHLVSRAASKTPASALPTAADADADVAADVPKFVIRQDMSELVHAIASLHSLRSLELKRLRLGNAAAQLAAATQLTHVRLEDCGVLDPAAQRVVRGLNAVG